MSSDLTQYLIFTVHELIPSECSIKILTSKLVFFRASPTEFVVPFAKYQKALYGNQISLGMRFRMMFETEELGTRRYMQFALLFSSSSFLITSFFQFPFFNK